MTDDLLRGSLIMIEELLEARGIDMSKTPPMMYPEAIASLVAKETETLRGQNEKLAEQARLSRECAKEDRAEVKRLKEEIENHRDLRVVVERLTDQCKQGSIALGAEQQAYEELRALVSKLRGYAQHTDRCMVADKGDLKHWGCDCGLGALKEDDHA